MTPAAKPQRQDLIRILLSYGILIALTMIVVENVPRSFQQWQTGQYPAALFGSGITVFLVFRIFVAWKTGHLQFQVSDPSLSPKRQGLRFTVLLFAVSWAVFLGRIVLATNPR